MSEPLYAHQSSFKLQKTWVIDYKMFEKLVNRMYYPDKPHYSFVDTEEVRNDTEHLYEVDRHDEIVDWDNPWAYDLFNKLCADGVICPGNYLVKVSW